MTKRYEIQHNMASGWENTWSDDNGVPITFESELEAIMALNDYISDEMAFFADGTIDSAPEPDDYRIMPVKE